MQPLTSANGRPISPAARGWLGFAEPLEQRYREPLHAILADVGVVESVYRPPDAWTDTRNRWEQYLEMSTPSGDRLTEWLASGRGDVVALRAAALAELGPPEAEADLRGMLAPRVCHTLATLWAPHALKAYTACAKAFDSAVTAGDTSLLDQGAAAMAAAARLCGADSNIAAWSVEKLTLGLTVSPERAHLRRVAEAFGQPSRWEAVTALGARLRAASDPLATYPPLPAYISCVDQNRVFTSWDPLDGPLPEHWQGRIDGWIG